MKKSFFGILAMTFLLTCSCQSFTSSSPAPNSIIPQVDDEIQVLMSRYNIPSLSLAITRNERIIYVKAFSSDIVDDQVQYYDRFRIASLSKPITAIAILKLREQGLLSLSDRVFGNNGILGTMYGTTPYSRRLTSVTVLNLLQHTAGGWANDGDDPMFMDPSLSFYDLISWTIDNQPLTSTPGQNYAYSNFGYCLLGRIIEQVSGMSYRDYVRTEILEPLSMYDTEIAGNTESDRKISEVRYYGQDGEDPYSFNIERMDAHGGWITTAIDLAKLLVHVDGFTRRADILSRSSINTMKTGSRANPGYGLGWQVNSADNWWHTGSLPGTYSLMVRSSGGFNWVLLMNSRSSDPQFGEDVDGVIWKAINDRNTRWPPNVDVVN